MERLLFFVLQMTSGEMKFALVVESVLNSVPEPEYRQMLVEALCVVSMIVENQVFSLTECVRNYLHNAGTLSTGLIDILSNFMCNVTLLNLLYRLLGLWMT